MTAKVLAFYAMGALVLILGIVLGCLSGFDATAWWMIGGGLVLGLFGLAVQMGWLNPPESK